jgi:hypothetical protein
MLTEREESLESKLQNQFELILSKLNNPHPTSPVRKKTTPSSSNEAPPPNHNQQPTIHPEAPQEDYNNNHNLPITNPYYQNTMRRRSVPNTLPASQS